MAGLSNMFGQFGALGGNPPPSDDGDAEPSIASNVRHDPFNLEQAAASNKL